MGTVDFTINSFTYLPELCIFCLHLLGARVGIVHEFVSSIFASLSRAEDEKKVPLVPIHIAEVTEQKQQQHHHLTVAPLHMTSHSKNGSTAVEL
ncbi:unnamed protein product [Adineta steineri]|uniref:Uncharacterized protein n=1 Tax=Adineta steineri TaxID=433720 RepID=A0A820D7L1_9BILA|nr:unnamed protein product [Adineta steineri]